MDKTKKHLMPVSFGPAAGPRQHPDGVQFEEGPTRTTRYSVRFLADEGAIARILPGDLKPWGEPLVSVELAELRNVAWLAGRGYNTLGVRFPAQFEGKEDVIKGQFLAVLWENLTDPIITGREQLGYPKIHASISDARLHRSRYSFGAHWLGYSFIDIELEANEPLATDAHQGFLERNQFGQGLIQHKYLPRTGEPWEEADANYFTFAPLVTARNREKRPPPSIIRIGTGRVRFARPRWEDMPTQFHIVNALADLPVHAWREASIIEALDYSDYSDQRILR